MILHNTYIILKYKFPQLSFAIFLWFSSMMYQVQGDSSHIRWWCRNLSQTIYLRESSIPQCKGYSSQTVHRCQALRCLGKPTALVLCQIFPVCYGPSQSRCNLPLRAQAFNHKQICLATELTGHIIKLLGNKLDETGNAVPLVEGLPSNWGCSATGQEVD